MVKSFLPPALLLAAMFALMLGSSFGDSAIMDELAHIPAGYSYLKFQEYRLNPEHPPLVKAIAAAPLLFLRPNYPSAAASWISEVNGQWDQGTKFLYESGNDADRILFWARLPMMFLTLCTGLLFWLWSRECFGEHVALLALFLFAFSPTFLAHGRFVTTDVGAVLGFLIGITSFLRYLASPTRRNIIITGVAFGVAELFKFSAVLLVPIYGILTLGWAVSRTGLSRRERAKEALARSGNTVFIGAIGLLVVSAVYAACMLHYPAERQARDSAFILSGFHIHLTSEFKHRVLHAWTRPFAEYLLGLRMVSNRYAWGHAGCFLGRVSTEGSRIYFPVVYFFKEPLALHLLTLIALASASARVLRARPWSRLRLLRWMEDDFRLFAAWSFLFVYWAVSVKSRLNLGVRHVLPTFPFIYLLVSREIVRWTGDGEKTAGPKLFAVGVLLIWIMADTLRVYPHFLSYYNELAGGPANGYRIALDSNYDWGQDLRRLTEYVEKNNIRKIHLDYFGGGSPAYYLGNRFVSWSSAKGPAHGYFAVSATLREGAMRPAAPEVRRKPEDSYEWLKSREPIDRVGYSIFVYKLP